MDPARTYSKLASLGVQQYWPTPDDIRDLDLEDLLFGAADSPGTKLIDLFTRFPPSTKAVELRGAGPLGPAGAIRLAALSYRKLREANAPPELARRVPTYLVPLLAAHVLRHLRGGTDAKNEELLIDADAIAFGQLFHPLGAALLPILDDSATHSKEAALVRGLLETQASQHRAELDKISTACDVQEQTHAQQLAAALVAEQQKHAQQLAAALEAEQQKHAQQLAAALEAEQQTQAIIWQARAMEEEASWTTRLDNQHDEALRTLLEEGRAWTAERDRLQEERDAALHDVQALQARALERERQWKGAMAEKEDQWIKKLHKELAAERKTWRASLTEAEESANRRLEVALQENEKKHREEREKAVGIMVDEVLRQERTKSHPTPAHSAAPHYQPDPTWRQDGRRYNLGRMIGEGAHGRVQIAEDLLQGRTVAIKFSRCRVDGQPPSASLREVELLQQLRNFHIVPLFDVIYTREDEQQPATLGLVMPLAAYDLSGVIHDRNLRLSIGMVKLYSRQILRGLLALHSANYLHGDLKPANILVHADHHVEIADLGMAENVYIPTTRRVLTSRNYRAPEILLRTAGRTTAADIWSFGAIMAELLSGKVPFCGADAYATLELILDHTGADIPLMPGMAVDMPSSRNKKTSRHPPRPAVARMRTGGRPPRRQAPTVPRDPRPGFNPRNLLAWYHPRPEHLEGGLDYERLMLAEELGEAYHQPSLWEINLGRIPPQPLYRFKLEGQEIWEDGVEGDMERIAAILRAARISADDE
ncbi:mitogen-activated protein kinase [Tilletia horrida]|nr:mitogen-activated protein kinase [Tilletia horrida]